MTTERETQPQDAVLEGLELEGASDADQSPQTRDETEGHQPGAEQQDTRQTPKERTYTQTEWSARESAKDQEIAETRRQLVSLAQSVERERADAKELGARTTDARAVDEGQITQSEAGERTRRRAADATEQSTRSQERATHQQLLAEGEVMGRALMAQDLATELGVDARALIEDQAITNQQEMRVKARELALEKRETELKGTESYDEGLKAGSGGGYQTYVQKLKDGGELPSAAEIDRLTARYLTGR